MAQTFRIATTSTLDNEFNVIGAKSKVSEQLFWQIVNSKVKELTEGKPEKFDETLESVKNHLKKQSVSIEDTWFECKGRP